jgi:isoleucyl-tRNA synthetase
MCADTPQAADYKDTLNLPRTEFPMRAGLPEREPQWLARWAEIGIYDRLRDKAQGRKPFTLHDGPPYANGHLHIGHALNKILKDMVVRSQQMMGRDARYIPGWDCHGLPIEWKIEEQYRAKGLDKDAVDVVDFRQECRKFAEGWVDIQREEFKRLGVTGTWDRPYLTMDFHAERVIAEEFQTFLMTGTLYQGSKPVMWSPVEQTALAEAEVEYHDKESFTVWVKFEVVAPENEENAASFLPDRVMSRLSANQFNELVPAMQELHGAKVVIWTTTPWTIPSNKAVVYGEHFAYGLYEVLDTPAECWATKGERFLLADKLAAGVMTKARLTDGMWRRVRDVTSDELTGLTLRHPLAGRRGRQGRVGRAARFPRGGFRHR